MGEVPDFELLVRVLDHHHRRIDHRPDRNGDPAQGHDIGVDALVDHDDKRGEDPQRQRDDSHERRAQMKQEYGADDGDHDEFLEQFFLQILDRALDEIGSIISRHHFNPGGETRFKFCELGLHRCDRRQRVLARTHDDDAASHLAFAVQLGDPTTHFWTHLHPRHVAQTHADAGLGGGERDLAEVVQRR